MCAARTDGFRVSAQPGINYLDPRLLTAQPTAILPAIAQGAGTVAQLSNIYENAQAAPIRRELQQIQLQDARNRLGQIPLENQLRELQVAKASMPIENIVGSGVTEVNRYPTLQSIGDDGQIITEQPAGADVFATETVDVYDPVTRTTKQVTRNRAPLSTIEQQQSARNRAEAVDAGLDIKSREAEVRALREQSMADTRQLRAQIAREQANNPEWRIAGRGADAAGNIVYTQVNPKTGEQRTIATDLLPIQTVNAFDAMLAGMVGGRGAGGPVPVAPKPAAVDADIQDLISTVSGGGRGNAFNNIAEAEAAAAAGRLKPGTKITIGGQSGTWQ